MKTMKKLIRLIAWTGIVHNRKVQVKYVKSKENVLSDSLSRLDFKCFWTNAPKTLKAKPDKLPDAIWPVEHIWNQDFHQFIKYL